MIKTFIYKFTTKTVIILAIIALSVFLVTSFHFLTTKETKRDYAVKKATLISLSPALTEIIYALNAQDKLVAVSFLCDYPKDIKNKAKIGDTFFLNKEEIIKLAPQYVLADKYSETILKDIEPLGIEVLTYQFSNINDIYININKIAKITNKEKEAEVLINKIKREINKTKSKNRKRILYLIQTNPMVTIGKKSFITDIINKSGNISVTQNLNSYYPTVNPEYLIKSKPEIIIINTDNGNIEYIEEIFKNAKIIYNTKHEIDVISRPGPRVYEAVKYFSHLQ